MWGKEGHEVISVCLLDKSNAIYILLDPMTHVKALLTNFIFKFSPLSLFDLIQIILISDFVILLHKWFLSI